MGILQRFGQIMKSNINALLDKCEDPEKMIDQLLLDARKDLAEVKQNTAEVMADEKAALRRVEDNASHVSRYEAAAKKALMSGNEDDARELLAKKQSYDANTAALQQAYDLAHANAEKMRAMTLKLTNDISDLESRKDNIKAKAAAAKAQEKINSMVSGTKNMTGNFEAFDRMEEKVNKKLDAALSKAELDSELAEPGNLLSKYEAGSSASVDDELERLKQELGK